MQRSVEHLRVHVQRRVDVRVTHGLGGRLCRARLYRATTTSTSPERQPGRSRKSQTLHAGKMKRRSTLLGKSCQRHSLCEFLPTKNLRPQTTTFKAGVAVAANKLQHFVAAALPILGRGERQGRLDSADCNGSSFRAPCFPESRSMAEQASRWSLTGVASLANASRSLSTATRAARAAASNRANARME